MLPAIVSAARHNDAAYILSLIKHAEASGAFEVVHELYKLHTEAQVRFVTAETAHSLLPCHLLKFRQLNASNLTEEHAAHLFKEVDDIVLVYERHLAVYLSELRLPVGTQVFVAEALGYLEVTVETGHHEQLLQGLRALWQGVELSRVHA